MRETTISALIRKAICRDGRAVVTRCNTGMAFYPNRDGSMRPVRYGLGRGSPDLPGMITTGPCRGRVFCLETKVPKKGPSVWQKAWARACRMRGGFYAVVHSVPDAMAALERALRGESQ